MSNWWPARQGMAALALLSAALTGALGIGLAGGGVPWSEQGAAAYFAVSVLAVFFPPAIAAQVIGGQLFLGALLLHQPGLGPLFLVPGVATIIVTAELLATVARMDTPMGWDPRNALSRTGLAALMGGGVFLVVALLSGLPGPTGLLAVTVASVACIVVAAPLFTPR